ncbi:pyrrolysine--tRNA(Pyl) ligase large subunit [Pseudobacteroides cellulosolvens]|uniref:Pyrrolysyl-tRNA synthetase n=1 Tax=Pseudobacteroides cellulosolvens ATCC 35603 = DSM 2933 TaxID=398512 RepID=A0A0L6JQL1_9FIRM|nr:pyrrolysine--tRNA(Pyl) ligase large subunit [Pseudobacteroides cellulosolvens]KNY27980.1 pyrrolysyl-tRNA synthetase [Pseudobacteroides cellulosolvens ATCC 35603 = DSM 2933]
MSILWSESQKKRLGELGAKNEQMIIEFDTLKERDSEFKKIEKVLAREGRSRLEEYRKMTKRPPICELETKLINALNNIGFVQVTTPVLLSKGLLEKMTIDDNHTLFSQVFWVDGGKCLRPMLAPNLYYILKDLVRIWEMPVRIFEIGSCFRKESQGSEHLSEFTMLNLVEWGTADEDREKRIEELAKVVMKTVGIEGYHLERTSSVVYGDTVDVMLCDTELGSSAMGPHFLDEKWGMTGPWIGIGFGLERLLMAKEGGRNIHSMGKSITYLNGVRLNI